MSCELYANIGIGHENDFSVIRDRVVAAAQCNADAIVISKSTPRLLIQEDKQYVSIPSKWGHLPYIDVAKKSELSADNINRITDLCEEIGIPLIWSVTDIDALSFLREHTTLKIVKMHFDCVHPIELMQYCKEYQIGLICKHLYKNDVKRYLNGNYQLYYSADSFSVELKDLNLGILDSLVPLNVKVGYESKEPGIFPAVAVSYKGVSFIEKYLGDVKNDHPSVLSPDQFYDLWNSMNILEQANGS